MGIDRKMKSLSRKQITNILDEYEDRFEAIADSLETLMLKQPDYSGCLQLNIFDVNEKLTHYYMVTKYCIIDPYITFFHLLPVDNTVPVTINSFPEKPDKQSTRKYIRGLEKTKRWNKVYESLFLPSVERLQFIGRFTYTRTMSLEDNPARFERPENSVIPFKPDS